MNQLFSFFIDNFPSLKEILIGSPPGLASACACLCFAGYLKKYRGMNTGYTRKIFHFLIFSSAAVIHFMWGLPGVFLFGAMTSLVIFYALLRGDGHGNFWFAEAAIIGYLVTGIGDAVAEPVGVRWGKHQYRVPSLSHVKSLRSLEGSAAVFFASAVMIVPGIALSPHFSLSVAAFWKIPLLALLCMVVEAVSPHGWDNATMQIIPAFLATLLL
jgi:phytol kinase